jgi:hypothetical protein
LVLYIITVLYIEDTQKNITAALKVVLKEVFHECFQQWQHYWAECMAAQMHYFECGHTH